MPSVTLAMKCLTLFLKYVMYHWIPWYLVTVHFLLTRTVHSFHITQNHVEVNKLIGFKDYLIYVEIEVANLICSTHFFLVRIWILWSPLALGKSAIYHRRLTTKANFAHFVSCHLRLVFCLNQNAYSIRTPCCFRAWKKKLSYTAILLIFLLLTRSSPCVNSGILDKIPVYPAYFDFTVFCFVVVMSQWPEHRKHSHALVDAS